jgi:hypothetical protein
LSVPTSRALLIAAEQVRTQYRNMPTAFISNAAVSLILCITLREAVPLPRLGWWLCAAYAWALGRFLLWRAFKRADPPPSDIAVWGNYGLAGSALNGIIWGLGGIVLYVPGNLSSQFLLLIVQFGMGSGAAFASASALPSFLAYFYPSLLLSAVPFFREGDSVHVSLRIMLLLFVAATTRFTVGVSRTIVDAIKLRFENINLISELREQTTAAEGARQAAEEANIAKSRFLAAASWARQASRGAGKRAAHSPQAAQPVQVACFDRQLAVHPSSCRRAPPAIGAHTRSIALSAGQQSHALCGKDGLGPIDDAEYLENRAEMGLDGLLG